MEYVAPEFTINVFPGDADLDALNTQFENQDTVLALKTIEPGSRADNANTFPTWFWLLWLIAPGILLGFWGTRTSQRFIQRRTQQYRAQGALKKALTQLNQLQGERGDQHILERVIRQYVADKRNVDVIDQATVSTQLQGIVPRHHVDQLQSCLVQVQNADYAPAGVTLDLQGLIKKTKTTLREVEQAWEEQT